MNTKTQHPKTRISTLWVLTIAIMLAMGLDSARAQQAETDDPVVARYREVLIQAGTAACQTDPANVELCRCLNEKLVALSHDPNFVAMLKGGNFDAESIAARIARIQIQCVDQTGQ